MTQDFWAASGYLMLERNDHGWLRVTPAWLDLLLARPELAPIPESGPRERALHAALVADPLRPVTSAALAELKDADTRENYGHFLRFRKALLDAVTLERFYLRQFRQGAIDLPPLFLDLVAQAVLRNLLDGESDPFQLRAGELFFRRQRVANDDGQLLAADAETIAAFADAGGFGGLGRLLMRQGTPLRAMHMDVLSHETAPLYWMRENRHGWLLDLTPGRPALPALARVMEKWIGHFLGVRVAIEPSVAITDAAWRWHTGLDLESSAMLNDLYNGLEVDAARRARLLSLFRLTFDDARDMRADVAGHAVYLGLAVTEARELKLKPQNLLVNLPLATQSA